METCFPFFRLRCTRNRNLLNASENKQKPTVDNILYFTERKRILAISIW